MNEIDSKTKELANNDKKYLEFKSYKKYDIKLTDLSAAIAIISTVLFVSSYVYNYLYYDFIFGIDISKFFAISDYLSSTINNIGIASISALYLLLLFFYRFSKKRPLSSKSTSNYPEIIFFISSLFFSIYCWFYKPYFFYFSISLFAILPVVQISKRLAFIFKNFLKSYIIILSFLFYNVNLLKEPFKKAYLIKNNTSQYIVKVKIDGNTFSEMVLLGQNSRYLFLSDTLFNQKTIIPNDNNLIFKLSDNTKLTRSAL